MKFFFITRIHPESKAGKILAAKMKELVKESVSYSLDFLKWNKAFELKRHWLAYSKKICPRFKIPLHKQYPGVRKPRSFFCNNYRKKY
jgi:endonuclease VIII